MSKRGDKDTEVVESTSCFSEPKYLFILYIHLAKNLLDEKPGTKKTVTRSITKEECWKKEQNNITNVINADADYFRNHNWSESANHMNESPMWRSKLNQCNQKWWICKQKLIQDVFVWFWRTLLLTCLNAEANVG